MYDLVYAQMISAGIARALEPSEYYWINEEGEKVNKENDSEGMQIKNINNSP